MLLAGPDIRCLPRRAPGRSRRVVSACLASVRFAGRCARSTLLVAALGLLAPGTLAAEESGPPKTVLILLPDQPFLPGTSVLLAGVRGPLVAAWGPRISIYTEHVDVERKRHPPALPACPPAGS